MVFSVSAAHEASRPSNEYLCTEFLFFRGVQRSHHDPDRGLTTAIVEEALRQDGQPVEDAWPYLDAVPDPTKWQPPTECEPVYNATIRFSTRTLSEVRDLLHGGVPVVLVVSLTTGMYTPDVNGIVRFSPTDSVTTSRHAWLAVGSGHNDGGEYLLVRNSWGSRWGSHGHAWIHDSCFNDRLHATGTIS